MQLSSRSHFRNVNTKRHQKQRPKLSSAKDLKKLLVSEHYLLHCTGCGEEIPDEEMGVPITQEVCYFCVIVFLFEG
jgi:hypothetical protein